mmetsp:Transcript_18024/g.68009  ORF Transcript_18024/g.68009 Transcript_18024/m.68009 type:complete len:324 (+) Transcript_18024:275-1246(+)
MATYLYSPIATQRALCKGGRGEVASRSRHRRPYASHRKAQPKESREYDDRASNDIGTGFQAGAGRAGVPGDCGRQRGQFIKLWRGSRRFLLSGPAISQGIIPPASCRKPPRRPHAKTARVFVHFMPMRSILLTAQEPGRLVLSILSGEARLPLPQRKRATLLHAPPASRPPSGTAREPRRVATPERHRARDLAPRRTRRCKPSRLRRSPGMSDTARALGRSSCAARGNELPLPARAALPGAGGGSRPAAPRWSARAPGPPPTPQPPRAAPAWAPPAGQQTPRGTPTGSSERQGSCSLGGEAAARSRESRTRACRPCPGPSAPR